MRRSWAAKSCSRTMDRRRPTCRRREQRRGKGRAASNGLDQRHRQHDADDRGTADTDRRHCGLATPAPTPCSSCQVLDIGKATKFRPPWSSKRLDASTSCSRLRSEQDRIWPWSSGHGHGPTQWPVTWDATCARSG